MLNKLKKYSIYGILPLAALALFATTNTASACSWGWGKNIDPTEMAERQQAMFQEKADLLGTTIDKVKDSWAKGQTLIDLANELGISDSDLQAKLKAKRLSDLKSHLQILVEKGVITQSQANQRYTIIEQRLANNAGKPGMGMGRGGRYGGGLGGFGW